MNGDGKRKERVKGSVDKGQKMQGDDNTGRKEEK